MTALHLITKGEVQVNYPGGFYRLGKGDVIGICELCSEVHFLSYTCFDETVILTYPINNMEALDDFMLKHPDVTRIFLLSMMRQIDILLEQCSISEAKCTGLHQSLIADCQKYSTLCGRYRIQGNLPEGIDDAVTYFNEESPDVWLHSYYNGLHHLYTTDISKPLILEPGVTLGMLRKGSLDFRKTFSVLDEQYQYCSQIAEFYFSQSGNDLFALYSALYYQLDPRDEDAKLVEHDINRMIQDFESASVLSPEQFSSRVRSFQSAKERKPAVADSLSAEDATLNQAILDELSGSMNTILEFGGCDSGFGDSFRKNVIAYKALEDKNSSDDAALRLRKKITSEFYDLYTAVFTRAVESPYLPMSVKMFLYFGYIDEELAGPAHCITLYNLACGMQDTSKYGVYTLYDWLIAIYNGDKNPSRNEFDEDYTDYIHKQKVSGTITASQETSLLRDPVSRVKYELQNQFPSTNKMTFGRVTTFCPLFTSDNVLKDLDASYLSATRITKTLDTIRSVDYTAFYRESLDYDNIELMGKEIIHVEYLPDIILMPNVGIRGVMWQEIEGKKRNTPGRMFFSIFHMEDINTTMVRLTGEFRWEMCKRIQGSRWNDVSDRSLTSEYFDYIQFFRKNHELGADAKEKIKNSLQKAKNSFKEMFVRDYIVWVLFEGAGSPRLNKVARKILFTYCPFPASQATALKQNPLFSELLEQQHIQTARKVHHLEVVIQKLKNSGVTIPETLEKELSYIQGKV